MRIYSRVKKKNQEKVIFDRNFFKIYLRPGNTVGVGEDLDVQYTKSSAKGVRTCNRENFTNILYGYRKIK